MGKKRSKGMGGITFVKSRKVTPWKASVEVDGVKKVKYFKTKKEAEAFLNEQRNRDYLMAPDYTFADYAPVFTAFKEPQLKPRSIETLKSTIKIINAHIPNVKLKELNNDMLQKLIYKLHELEYSQDTLLRVKNYVIAMLKKAAADNIIPFLPVFNIVMPSQTLEDKENQKDAKTNCFTDAEMALYSKEAIRTIVSNNRYSRYYGKAMLVHPNGWKLMLLLHTGLRLGELLALEWSDFQEKSKTLTVNKNVVRVTSKGKTYQTPKTESGERVIILNKQAYQDILKLRAIFDEQTKELKQKRNQELQQATTEEAIKAVTDKYDEYERQHRFIAGSTTFPYGSGGDNALRETHNSICDRLNFTHDVTLHGLRHKQCVA